MTVICSRSGIIVRQVFTLLRLEQRGKVKIRNRTAGKEILDSGVSKVHSLFPSLHRTRAG